MEDVDEHGRDEDIGVDVHGGMDGYRHGRMRAGARCSQMGFRWTTGHRQDAVATSSGMG